MKVIVNDKESYFTKNNCDMCSCQCSELDFEHGWFWDVTVDGVDKELCDDCLNELLK